MLRSEIGRGEIKTVRIVTVIPSLVGFNELKKKSLTPIKSTCYLSAFAFSRSPVFKLFPLFSPLSVNLSLFVGFSYWCASMIVSYKKLKSSIPFKSLSTVALPSHIVLLHFLFPFPSIFLQRVNVATLFPFLYHSFS